MSGKWIRRSVLCMLQAVALTGLCASPQANTTGAPGSASGNASADIRITVLLPLRSASLGSSAEAVRAGIRAANERDPQGVSLNVVETDGTVVGALSAYAKASENADIVIGPLSRTEVGGLAQRGKVRKPTIALALPETDLGGDTALPPTLLAIGLSIEEEARQVANWINASQSSGSVMIVSTAVPWQRRAAKAFAAQWQTHGRTAQTVELGWSDNFLNSVQVAQLKKRLSADAPVAVFVALDAAQASQLRNSIGKQLAMYGTSQLNPVARTSIDSMQASNADTSEIRDRLEGVRLVELPWQLEAEHPAVMVYPQLLGSADAPVTADQARLYALGIDAYRIAYGLVQRGGAFELDGVTGKLLIRFEPGTARFERILQAAVYRDGVVAPLREGR